VATQLGQKGDWVVMAALLVHLRARLLQPAGAAGGRQRPLHACGGIDWVGAT
jgi:hypothetical protein